jgi:hypothetical protein
MSHYQMAADTVTRLDGEVSNEGKRTLDTPALMLAAAQVDALLAVADQLRALTGEVSRLSAAVETVQEQDVAGRVTDAANLLREQIRASLAS